MSPSKLLMFGTLFALSRVLAPIAMGASNPVAPNETAQGRAENRRATVRVGVNRGIGE